LLIQTKGPHCQWSVARNDGGERTEEARRIRNRTSRPAPNNPLPFITSTSSEPNGFFNLHLISPPPPPCPRTRTLAAHRIPVSPIVRRAEILPPNSPRNSFRVRSGTIRHRPSARLRRKAEEEAGRTLGPSPCAPRWGRRSSGGRRRKRPRSRPGSPSTGPASGAPSSGTRTSARSCASAPMSTSRSVVLRGSWRRIGGEVLRIRRRWGLGAVLGQINEI
jgi:hypothetical protein